ncbi:metalloendopeptidase [Cellulomonas chitinilytica]|uniref:Metalloendopeptidase n=1 Tax=Cellulomonas chitinilytica TaxID=398759 RepID=A0A919P367_9CELL|nr:M23 family metallopeptidase [Cellulomonas chitinilytica]GIG22482.1 metalloendopeptidase [Cellulomonas chitinilytica]
MTRHLRLTAVVSAIALLLGIGLATPAGADAIDDKRKAAEQKKAANAKARDDAEDAMEGLDASLQTVIAALQDLEAQIPAAQATLDAANASLEKAQREAAIIAARLQDATEQQTTITTTIDQDAQKAAALRGAIGQMAREAYRSGGEVSGVGMILDADSTEDFVQRYGLMSTALRTQAQVLDALKATEAKNKNAQARLVAVQERVTELKAAADQKVVEADAARAAAAAARQTLDDLLAQQVAQQQNLEAQKAAIAAQLAAIDAEAAQVQAELQAAIAEQKARDAAAGVSQGPAGPIGNGLFGNPTATNPIYVTSEYGMRFHPILHYWRLHAGIDLRDHCGQPVYAGRAGTVQWAKARTGFGNQVMIDHGYVNGNALSSSYNHLTSFAVGAGQHVNAGQLVGYAGNTGTSAACHLHFEVYVNGATANPRPLLGL